MKSAALYILAGTFAALAFSVPLAAQEKTVSYVGTIIGGSRDQNCRDLDRGDPINIDIEGNSIKGSVGTRRSRLEGELRGAQINAKSGRYSILGSVEAGTMNLRLGTSQCNYTAVLKELIVDTYVGKLGLGVSSSGRGCSLNGSDIQIGVIGEEIKGTRKSSDGPLNRFNGKLQGGNFTIITKDSQGNETTVNGTVEADKIQLKLNRATCDYDAVLKKQS